MGEVMVIDGHVLWEWRLPELGFGKIMPTFMVLLPLLYNGLQRLYDQFM